MFKSYLLPVLFIFTSFLLSATEPVTKNNDDWRAGIKLCSGKTYDPAAFAKSQSLATLSPVGSGWWDDPTQWNLGRVPTSSDVVIIPEGANIHLRGNCNAKNITINGRVGFIPSASFNLITEWIIVNGADAKLEVGYEDNPYIGNGTITLKGTDDGDDIMGMGDKFIAAMNGGSIRLIGKQKIAWTQLGTTANKGANQITLKENVDWQVGDKIVIASTDYDMNHAEVRTITAVSGNRVTLNTSLNHKHFGKLQNYTRPDNSSLSWTLDERAEVGLLSRNLTIQGDAGSDATGFGGHIMAMSGATLVANNIELYRMGQKAKLGRYPWHWHLLGNDGQGQYLRNSSIHQTYNRAVTIHSTNGTTVERNVAHNNLGHAYFFEDGNEVNNIMQYNLGLVTRRPAVEDALLPSDIDNQRNMSGPATFWITNPLNKINFNHAAGSDGSGIWFAPHQNANSAAFDPSVKPNDIPVPAGNWDNNVAHSSTHGLLVGPTVFANDASQKVNPNLDYYRGNAPGNTIIKVKNYTLFKNLLGAYLRVGQNTRDTYWENFIIADNYKGEALTWAGEQRKFLWVGGSDNYEAYPPGNHPAIGGAEGLVHLHTIYDGPARVYDSYFADVDYPEMSLFDQWGANIKYTGHTFRNTTVAPGSFNINWRNFSERPVWNNALVYDVDGKLSGTSMTAIHLNIPILSNETTTLINANQNGAKSNNRYAYVEVTPADESPSNKRQTSVTRRSDGAIQKDNVVEIEGVSIVPILDKGYSYTLRYKDYLPWRNRIDYHSMNAGEAMILGFPGAPSTASAFMASSPKSNSNGARLSELSSLAALKSSNQSACAFEGTTFYVKYIASSNAKFEDLGTQKTVIVYTNIQNQTNVPYLDTDGDGYQDVVENEQCRDPYNASDMAFNFKTSREGFQTNQIDAQSLSNNDDYWLLRADRRGDPFIFNNTLNFNGNDVGKIYVEAQSEAAGSFQLFFKTAASNSYSGDKVLTVNYPTANTRKTLEFNVANQTAWNNQTITGLRLDFPVNASTNSHTWLWKMYGENPSTGDCTSEILPGTYSIIAKHSNKALDVYGVSQNNGGNVNQWEYVNQDNQKWSLEHLGDNIYTIISKHSNKALDVYGRSQNNGGNVNQWEYVNQDNQKWKIEPVGDGYYKVIALHSGKALTVHGNQVNNGANVNQWEYVNQDNQKWRFDRLDQVGSRRQDRLKDLSGRTTLDQKAELNWYYHLPTQVNEVSSYTLQHYDEALEEFVDVETFTADSFDDPNSVQTTFTHNRPAVGANYYKVRVEFANGEYDYSEYETIVLAESTMPITIAPNPANNELRLDLSNFRTVGVQYLIMDMQGKEWSKGYYNEGHTELEVIDLSAYRNGNYFIYLKPENRRGFSQQFMVMKDY